MIQKHLLFCLSGALSLLAQDEQLSWHDPVAVLKRNGDILSQQTGLASRLLSDAKGDVAATLKTLLEKRSDPDYAQTLFQAMRELAPQGSEREAQRIKAAEDLYASQCANLKKTGQPLPPPPLRSELRFVSGNTPGIQHVLWVVERLQQDRVAKKEQRQDTILLEDGLRLLGFYGASQVEENRKISTADGKKYAPVNPAVRATLRSLLAAKDGPTQAMASRALGQLGDMETAREIIKKPRKYPSASIAHFGPRAVEEYKQAQLKRLEYGRSGEGEFWQSLRLTPKYQDTAIDLAMAGDSGAGLAMERNIRIKQMYADDEDAWMAEHFDILLRYPGSRAAYVASTAVSRVNLASHKDGKITPPQAALMRCLEHDLKIIFGKAGWTAADLTGVIRPFTELWHTVKYGNEFDRRDYYEFYKAMEALFRKNYQPKAMYHLPLDEKGTFSTMPPDAYLVVDRLSLYARHLGLPRIQHSIPDDYRVRGHRSVLGLKMPGFYKSDKDRMRSGAMESTEPRLCYDLGHISGPEDW